MTPSSRRSLASRLARVVPILLALALSVAALPLVACSGYGGAYGGNGIGATPGGVQDMGLARELIAGGTVPPPEAFVVEGMFSEHDLPLVGEPCVRTLCVRGAGALAPDREGQPAGWVQLGLSSAIDPAAFERPPVTLVATVDVSGSMGWNSHADSPGEISRALLHALVDQLHDGDELAIVTYGSSVSVASPLAPVDAASLHRVIGSLHENGSTNLEAGLTQGIAIARSARGRDAGRTVRLMLFTDEQPNVGATTPEAFGGMVASAAADDIGITVFGTGNGLGQSVFLAMSHLRGGNGFSLFHQSDVATVVEENWPWMLVPIAFDLHVTAMPSEGLEVVRGYGFPSATADAPVSLDVSTVFLSRRRGALLVQLGGALDASSVGLSLSYEEPDGSPVTESLAVTLPALASGSAEAYPQSSTRSTVALALLVEGMHEATSRYGMDPAEAVATMRAAHARIAADAALSSDASLDDEVTLAAELLELMERGAAQRGS